MKNTMYIVFGTFALLLFMITRSNPSFAEEWLLIDEALNKIAEQIVITDPLPEEDESETSNETLEEDVTEPEIDQEEKALEWGESSQDLEDDEDDKTEPEEVVDNRENEDWDEEWKTEESKETSETEEWDNSEEWKISITSFQLKSDSILTTLSDDWNTAIETVVDGKKAIIYNWKFLKINSVSSSSCWNAGSNPSENSVIEAVTMWCHLSDNNCDSSKLRDVQYPNNFYSRWWYGDDEDVPNGVTLVRNLDTSSINKMKTFFWTDVWWTSHDFWYEDWDSENMDWAFYFKIYNDSAYFSYEETNWEHITRCRSTQYYTPPKHPHLSFSISTYQTYTVAYNTHWWNTISSVQAASVILPAPTRNGYTFKWWCKDSETCSSPISAWTSQTITSNVTYHAQWAQNYTVTYDTQLWNTIPSVQASSVILPTPTRNGYTFKWWCKDSETCSSPISAWTSQTITSNVTYYAQRQLTEYTITYNLYGGTNSANNTWKYTIETPTITLQNATKEWYIFSGWFTSTNFTSANKITEIPTWTTGNKTLYALFQKTVTINFNVNWSVGENQQRTCTMNNAAISCSITSPSISAPEGWTSQWWSSETNVHTNLWSAWGSKSVSASGTYYAQFKKSAKNLTANFNKNWATSLTYTSTWCTIPEVWNWASQSDTCTVKAPNITREWWLIIWFNANQNWNTSTLNTWENLELSSSNNWVTYYAITKEILTWTFYLNWNTSQTPNGKSVSTAESVAETCNLWNTGTQCDIITPTYVPANWKIAKWYTTDVDVSSQSNPTFISTGISISLTSSAQYYAQSKSNDTILNVTYLSWVWVQWIWKDSDSCTLTWTWNSIPLVTQCTVKAPTITLKVGYKAWIWTTWNITKNPWDDIILTDDDTYTARAINNTDTQYHVNYYKENLDWTYDLFETWTWYWTTDTQAIVTWTDKSYVGFAFSWTNVNNVTSGNIDWDGSRVLSLYYDRVAYKLNYVVDGNIIQSGNVKYEADITVPVNPKKECNEFSWWTSSVDWLTTTGTMPDSDVTFTANWNYTCSRSSWGWWAKKVEKTTREIAIEPVVENEHNSADEKENSEIPEIDKTESNEENSNQVISVTQEFSEDGTVEAVIETVKIRNTDIVATVRTEVNQSSSSSSTTHTREQKDAYNFAKSNWITSSLSIDKARMDSELTRIEMAKMLSNYAINVLWIESDTSKWVADFKDVSEELNQKYDNAVTKAYQLWIMWQNMNKFRPNDKVTRAEFATALSRLLYNTSDWEFRWTRKYYIPHIAKLYNEWIVKTVIPWLKELRWYVMIMFMRTVK